MTEITNEFMQEMLGKSKPYNIVLLKAGPNEKAADAQQIIWEHARRNFQLRAEGKLHIVCPVRDESDVRGVGIFNVEKDELRKLMDEDPGIKSGLFIYEILACRSFPGDSLK
jgi:hypothetical protein